MNIFGILLCVCLSTAEARLPREAPLPKKCLVTRKEDCGYKGIPKDYCLAKGCCYDDSEKYEYTPWCYKASKDSFLTTFALISLVNDGVPQDIITALYADSYPGSEWLLAFKNGKLDTNRLLEIIAGNSETSLTINPVLAQVLAGEDPLMLVMKELSKYTGMNPGYLELLVEGKTKAVLKHFIAILSAQNREPGIPYNVIMSLLSGEGIDSKALLENYVDALFPPGDKFNKEFYKSLMAGKTNEAIQWGYLAAFQDRFPQSSLYPKNTNLFIQIVKSQTHYPGKIKPSILLALARGEIIPAIHDGSKTFKQLFGVSAEDYICAAHAPNLQTSCEKLRGRYYVSSYECIDAGCCYQQAIAPGEVAVCYENILGTIGVLLAQSLVNEEYVTEVVLGGSLIDVDNFIPWLPNYELPDQYTNFMLSGNTDYFAYHLPTSIPLKPNALRPNFQWKPHGPTPLPFPTKVPRSFLVATEVPGVLNEEYLEAAVYEEPGITQLELQRFGDGCRAVRAIDRYECISNSIALSYGGHATCVNHDCCYDPVWSDVSIPACFRKVNYGQCHDVAYEEREDCGSAGISMVSCLKNPQCCYDSAVGAKEFYKRVPWCYYKKRAPVREENRCLRRVSYDDRVGCFSDLSFNYYISQETCESVPGCCFELVKVSWLNRVLGRTVQPPPCYKGLEFDLIPTVPPPTEPTIPTMEVCKNKTELYPHMRRNCGDYNWFECVTKGCCFEEIPEFPGYPWCYEKSIVEAT